MKLLLDTHIWLWAALETSKLSEPTRAAILDPANTIHVSVASIWEVAIKTELGKLALPVPLAGFVAAQTGPGVATVLDITAAHGVAVASLPKHHRDPFDRLLIAQAQVEGLTLVTVDDVLRVYGIPIFGVT